MDNAWANHKRHALKRTLEFLWWVNACTSVLNGSAPTVHDHEATPTVGSNLPGDCVLFLVPPGQPFGCWRIKFGGKYATQGDYDMPDKKPNDKNAGAQKESDVPDLKDVEPGSDADAGPVEKPVKAPRDFKKGQS